MYLKRKVYERLINWKKSGIRSTLEVGGARQVGKTYLINKFADEYFNQKIYIPPKVENIIKHRCQRKACKRCNSGYPGILFIFRYPSPSSLSVRPPYANRKVKPKLFPVSSWQ